MTATATEPASRRRLSPRPRRDPDVPVPPLSPRLQLVRAVVVLVAVVTLSLLVELLFLSALQQRSAQQRLFDQFRAQLATGTAPVSQVEVTQEGEATTEVVLAEGSPMAYLEIAAIGLKQVVVEGSSSGATFDGPGHRRDTPFPGQAGTSMVMGRRASFGAPFAAISELEEGDEISVITGQGQFDYQVIGVRHENDPIPRLEPGDGRLTLVTADGSPFLPDGVLRVDARLVGDPVAGDAPLFTPKTLPDDEGFMASDIGTVWALVLWLQALIAVTLAFVWAWHRWGRAKAWIVLVPALLLVGLFTSEQVAKLLPNML